MGNDDETGLSGPEGIDLTESEAQNPLVGDNYVPEEAIKEEEYDPRPQEDTARRRIAYALLWMLGGVIIFSMINLVCAQVSKDKDAVDSLIRLVQVILSPLIALVSAATGFYYGSKNK